MHFFGTRNCLREGLQGLHEVVPETMKKLILKELHHQHPGIVRMKALARTVPRYHTVPRNIQYWKPALNPMDKIHMDYFGPFNDNMYLVLFDSYSRWCKVETVRKTDTKSTIEMCRNFFCRYGLPNQVVSDYGTQLTATEFKEFCRTSSIMHTYSALYHQSSNGQAERFV